MWTLVISETPFYSTDYRVSIYGKKETSVTS
jgi:hypothetical protein